MADLSAYKIEFWKLPLLFTWTYRITMPSGKRYVPMMASYSSKESAEKAALAHIKRIESRYEMSGDKLKEKYERQP